MVYLAHSVLLLLLFYSITYSLYPTIMLEWTLFVAATAPTTAPVVTSLPALPARAELSIFRDGKVYVLYVMLYYSTLSNTE